MTSASAALLVAADPANPQRGLLQYRDRAWPCALGRSGLRADKCEGDGATPVGRFSLRRVLYRADQVPRPKTSLSVTAIAHNDGWCDDPRDPLYNQPVKLPYASSAEAMWRDDRLYDLVVVIGHNDQPVIAGAGSAIFMHVAAADFEPTAGCIALKRDDLLSILADIGPGAVLDIRK